MSLELGCQSGDKEWSSLSVSKALHKATCSSLVTRLSDFATDAHASRVGMTPVFSKYLDLPRSSSMH
jgi:hypothetical protein